MSSSNALSIPQAVQLAQQHLARSEFKQAENFYRQILSIDPHQPQATHGLGLIALYAGKPEAAIDLFRRSVKLQPDNAFAYLDLGNALLSIGRLDDAAGAYRQALAIKPNFAGVHNNLGIALHELGRSQEAIECFEQAVKLNPAFPDAHSNLGNAMKSLGRFDEAIDAYRKALELRPDWAEAQNNLASALKDSGLIQEAIAACRRAIELKPSFAGAHSNLASFLSFDPARTPGEIFQEHRRWNQLHALPLMPRDVHYPNDPPADRRLRVGYVSPDMRDHSVSFFLEGLLAAHSKQRVEIFCYADLLRRFDATTQRLKQHADHFRDVTGQSDQVMVEMIRKDRIDILIDLAGHTAGNRLLVFARKPAPVQMSYLGYPNTTGLDAIDYFLCDSHTDPPGLTEGFFSEQLIRLPTTFATYRPPDDAPEVGPSPTLANGYVTFGSFNSIAKINDAVIACWSEILTSAGDARLLLVATGLQQPSITRRLREGFINHEIDPNRLEFCGAMPRSEYLKAHDRVDILLDPFPVNGHTVTCHALWMGVPVVTLAGQTHAGRLGASVLSNLGLPDLVAPSRGDYVRSALELAADHPRLAELRSNLRPMMRASPLMDYAAHAAHVERVLQWAASSRLSS